MNIHQKILDESNKNHKKNNNNEIERYTNKFLKDITYNLENFSYNKLIANLHEMYSFMYKQIQEPYTKITLIENYQKILIAMTPIIPHFSNECLNVLDMQDSKWPKYDETILKENIINIVVQINGKKRGLVKAELNITEEKLFEIIKNDETLTKYLNQKEFKKRIYIKNKLINIII